MSEVTYETDYPDPSYIKEAVGDSTADISGKGTKADPLAKLKYSSSGKHKCLEETNLSLVVPWSHYLDWWYRCNVCGRIIYVYDCQDKENDTALKFLMDKAGFKYKDKEFLTYVEKFLRKVCK